MCRAKQLNGDDDKPTAVYSGSLSGQFTKVALLCCGRVDVAERQSRLPHSNAPAVKEATTPDFIYHQLIHSSFSLILSASRLTLYRYEASR